MARHVRLRELLLGVEGLALLRRLYDGTDEDADRRMVEVGELLKNDELSAGEWTTEADTRSGYRAWSAQYDNPGNPIIAIEEPVVWSLLDSLVPGDALDAACGTGRHTGHLVSLGHRVVGVDVTPEMLALARDKVPGATFALADIRHVPADDGRFDVVVCGLAVAHLADLVSGFTELARVLRPGGRLIVSVLHPFLAHLGWHAPFEDDEGQRGFVREHSHTHADYFAAFCAAGTRVRRCVEPPLGLAEARAKRRAFLHIPEATVAGYVGLPGVLIWDAEKL